MKNRRFPDDKRTAFNFYWWPKIAAPKGWHQDRRASYHYGCNAVAPDGHTFANAETVLYAKASYKPRIPALKSLEQLIAKDKEDFLSSGVEIKEAPPLTTADGKILRSFIFTPKDKGNWERVSYGEEGDFYLTFTVSSRSLASCQSSEKIYEDFVRSYKQ